MYKNTFVFDKILWFSFLHENGAYHRNNSSCWEKLYSFIVAISEDP